MTELYLDFIPEIWNKKAIALFKKLYPEWYRRTAYIGDGDSLLVYDDGKYPNDEDVPPSEFLPIRRTQCIELDLPCNIKEAQCNFDVLESKLKELLGLLVATFKEAWKGRIFAITFRISQKEPEMLHWQCNFALYPEE